MHDELARAHTLPSSVYREAAAFKEEQKNIFARQWQPVARSHQLRNSGDYVATILAGEPLLIVRGAEGTLRALSNVCRHRASLLLEGEGNAKTIQCPYHAWTYGLEGQLRAAPEFEGVQDWQKETVCLPRFPVAEWGPFIFASLDREARPFLETVAGIPEAIASAGYAFSEYQFLTRTAYEIECNWKVYVDNYLEGYHIPTIHPALHKELDYKQYRVEPLGRYSQQHAPLRPDTGGERRYDAKADPRHPLYYWLFPNFMINVYPDNLHNTIVIPLSATRTFTVFEWFTAPGTTASLEQTISFSDKVQKEDIAICERVQRGLQSSAYDRGRYSVRRENGVFHFHDLWKRAMETSVGF